MNINLKSTLFYLFICTIFCNCSTFTGEQIEKTFDIDNFYTELQIEDAINVIISNEQNQISIITTENLINDVVIEKIDNKLRLYLKKKISTSIAHFTTLAMPKSPSMMATTYLAAPI